MNDVVVGQKVIRWLAGTIEMPMLVSEVTDDLIVCGAWTFCRKTGAEIDDDLGWGQKDERGRIQTGSFITVPCE